MNDTTAVLQEPSSEQRQREPTLGRHVILRVLIGGALVATGVGFGVPHVLGVDVASVLSSLGGVSVVEILALSAIWFLGIFVHSFVLTGALPGLTRIRALMLNLTGSALSNVLPFGGAASTALNFKMARTWDVSVAAFAAFALIANVWWIAVKLALPLCAVAVLVVMGGLHNATMVWAATASTLALAAAAGGLALVAGGHGNTLVRRVAAMFSRVAISVGRPCTPQHVTSTLDAARESTRFIVTSRWRQLCLGMFGYAVFQAVLLVLASR